MTTSMICVECEREYVCESCTGWIEHAPITRRAGENESDYRLRAVADVCHRYASDGSGWPDIEEPEDYDR